jgi:hypothetical protein
MTDVLDHDFLRTRATRLVAEWVRTAGLQP